MASGFQDEDVLPVLPQSLPFLMLLTPGARGASLIDCSHPALGTADLWYQALTATSIQTILPIQYFTFSCSMDATLPHPLNLNLILNLQFHSQLFIYLCIQ